MPSVTFKLLLCTAALLQLLHTAIAASPGYHYHRPTVTVSLPALSAAGHHFAPLATVSPLPPVPALPPLPTPRGKAQIQSHVLTQVHPPPPAKSIAAAYRSPSGTPASHYAVQTGTRSALPGAPTYGQRLPSVSAYNKPASPIVVPSAPGATAAQYQRGTFGQTAVPQYAYSGQSLGTAGAAPSGPPLRVPFGKSALISNFPSTAPDSEFYVANGRQLKQYAVVEIIDNDIEPDTKPFLQRHFFDSIRARIGASGTGAVPPPTELQPHPSAMFLAQQRIADQQSTNGNPITLGSGGLGYVRLPDGSIYLGSGSLGFISGQQVSDHITDARTRSGTNPDALHFGHGPLGGKSNFFPFK